MYPHSSYLCYEGVEGETPDNHRALEVVSSSHLVITGGLTHKVVPYAHTVVVCIGKGGGTSDKHGALNVVFK